MSSQKYESGKLNSILQSLLKKNASGILSLKTRVPSWHHQRSCILMLRSGALVYGELNINRCPNNVEICQMLGEKLKPNLIKAALSVARERTTDRTSVRELIDLLVRMRVFTWQEVEALITDRIVLILEQFLSFPGEASWQKNANLDLCYGQDKHGLSLSDIKREINQRRQKWKHYADLIPNMGAIPYVTPEQLQQIDDRNVKKHLIGSADGKNNLLDIADKIGKDPLKVAKSYANWINNGWVSIGTSSQIASQGVNDTKAKIESIQNQIKSSATPSTDRVDKSNLPIVLSVDDSPIIQISIKRALQEDYNVLLASKATDALKMLNSHPVKLMLLDLTMPDVDGLEFCQSVRKIPKFKDLPIVMVTARDGLVNKMKGHIAGTSKYLTKPFQPEQLRQVVSEYIHS